LGDLINAPGGGGGVVSLSSLSRSAAYPVKALQLISTFLLLLLPPPQSTSAATVRAAAAKSGIQTADTQQVAAAVQAAVNAAQQALPHMSPQYIAMLLTVMADLVTLPGAVTVAVQSDLPLLVELCLRELESRRGRQAFQAAAAATEAAAAADDDDDDGSSRVTSSSNAVGGGTENRLSVKAVAEAVGRLGLAQPQAVQERLAF